MFTKPIFCAGRAAIAVGFAAMFASTVQAQAAYPSRTVRIVVPFAPAGGTDILARSLAQRFAEGLGRQVLVENRPGANALIGTEAVAKAAPDGHTLLMTTNIFTINPWLYPSVPFNVERDFAPITLAGSAPNLLAVHPSIPVRSVKELVAFSQTRPGEVTIAAAGLGTPSHLAAELAQAVREDRPARRAVQGHGRIAERFDRRPGGAVVRHLARVVAAGSERTRACAGGQRREARADAARCAHRR